MQPNIIYAGLVFRKHYKQEYYYNPYSKPYRSLHRRMWFDVNGMIPKGYHLHHKNGDPSDNRLDNFELKERFSHLSEHGKTLAKEKLERFQKAGIKKAAEWHKSKDGVAWHKQHAKAFKFGEFDYGKAECEDCGKKYHKKTKRSRFCSNACKSNWRRKNKPDLITKSCPTCGQEYQTRKYLPAKYCSKACTPAPNPNGKRKKPT
jgi:endogenous inhibitor of DNA gyrase (YacG/DUF329 family)